MAHKSKRRAPVNRPVPFHGDQTPAIRGRQAGREYYISMWTMRKVVETFYFNDDDDELRPELRAQRTLNANRIPEMAQYIVDNPKDYIFSAITASINVEVEFEPYELDPLGRVGQLKIPEGAKFIINDGQHRRAAMERAIDENPDFKKEHIAVVLFLDRGLKRCQQMFADLNRNAIRPAKSLGVLYDHRDPWAMITRTAILGSDLFRNMIELERSALSSRSRKLFTLSGIHGGTKALLQHVDNPEASIEELATLARSFWETVATHFPEWQKVRENKMQSGEVREHFIHSHGITLQALGRVGSALIQKYKGDRWKQPLRKLETIDWSRDNAKVWEGRAIVGGKVSKAYNQVTLTTNVIKQHLGLALTPVEQRIEGLHLRGDK